MRGLLHSCIQTSLNTKRKVSTPIFTVLRSHLEPSNLCTSPTKITLVCPLWPDSHVPSLVRRTREESLAQTHGGLNHAANGKASADIVGGIDVFFVGYIAAHYLCGNTGSEEPIHKASGFGLVATRATEEDEMASTSRHHPSAQTAAKAAQTSNEQVDLLGTKSRLLQCRHDLLTINVAILYMIYRSHVIEQTT